MPFTQASCVDQMIALKGPSEKLFQPGAGRNNH